ncbi:MAG: hypothetical protein M5U12_03940 [Verrucomicrobia bacterium]|nr:hypothetical protein [Verrucomicrobiota bacterium]
MDSRGSPGALRIVALMFGPHTRPILCAVGWGDRHDARHIRTDAANNRFGIYGFSQPRPDSLLRPIAGSLANPIEPFKADDRNLAVRARVYNAHLIPASKSMREPGHFVLGMDPRPTVGADVRRLCLA